MRLPDWVYSRRSRDSPIDLAIDEEDEEDWWAEDYEPTRFGYYFVLLVKWLVIALLVSLLGVVIGLAVGTIVRDEGWFVIHVQPSGEYLELWGVTR